MPDPMRPWLKAAVAAPKKGDGSLDSIIDQINRRDLKISDALLPDFASFLRDPDPQVQLLGATGLRALANPKSAKPLMKYLYAVDTSSFHPKPEVQNAPVTEMQAKRILWTWQAVSTAAAALGDLGDASAIPAIERVKDCPSFGSRDSVTDTLSKLGAVRSIARLPHDATREQKSQASSMMSNVRDPKKVPELMRVVRDKKAGEGVRAGAVAALGEINPPGVAKFLVSVFQDGSYPASIRYSALSAAGKTHDPNVEEPLLRFTDDPDYRVRVGALTALVMCSPPKYISRWFDAIMDTRESTTYRAEFLMLVGDLPAEFMRTQKQQFYRCLEATDVDGKPNDQIRATAWYQINRIFREQAPVTFSGPDSHFASTVTGQIRRALMRRGGRPSPEIEQMIDQRVREIVSYSSESPQPQE
jgi:HEAT repeat protein